MSSPDSPAAPDLPRTPDQIAVDVAIRLGVVGLFAWLSLSLVAPFALVVVWAIILTVALYPTYTWLRDRLGGRGRLAALLITIIGLLVIFGPAAVLLTSLIDSVNHLIDAAQNRTLLTSVPKEKLAEIPVIGPWIEKIWLTLTGNFSVILREHGGQILQTGGILLGSAAGFVVGILAFTVSVIISGMLFAPGPSLVRGARAFATRIAGHRGDGFVDMAGVTIRNVSQGVIGISMFQALLMGIVMMVAHVPAAGLLAFIAMVLGIIQVGPMLIVLGTVIWAWTAMGTGAAIVFTVLMFAAGLLDNAIKPFVMSKGLKTPMLVILTGVIGGTVTYGLLGLFLGPIVLAVFYELIVAWVRLEIPTRPGPTRAA